MALRGEPNPLFNFPPGGSPRGAVIVGIGVALAIAACGGRPDDESSDGIVTGYGDGETGFDDGGEEDGGTTSGGEGSSTGGDDGDSGGSTSGGSDGSTSGGSTSGGSDGSTSGGSTSGGSGGSTSGGSTSGGTTAGSGEGGDPNDDGWEIIDVGTDEDLVAVDFADPDHGWLVGTNEVLLHTSDGGQNWNSQENGFWTKTTDTKQLQAHTLNPYPAWGVYHLLDVHAVSQDIAWVSSIGPLKQPVSLNPDHLTAVFVTQDGGSNWTRLTLATNFQVWGIHGFDGQSARAATIGSDNHPDSDVYQIENGANQGNAKVSWGGLRDIIFVDDQEGWMAGSGIFHSSNGGTSWSEQDAPGAFYQAIEFVDADHGWAVGKGGKIIVTLDGGNSWESLASGTNTDLYGVSFVDQDRGFVVGDGGIILRTDDGGQNWDEEDSGTNQWINDVVATSASEAWASADGGVLLHRVP